MTGPAIAIVDGQLRMAPEVHAAAVKTIHFIVSKLTPDGEAIIGVGLSIVLLAIEQMPRERVRETVNALVLTVQRFTNDLLTPTLIVPAGGGE